MTSDSSVKESWLKHLAQLENGTRLNVQDIKNIITQLGGAATSWQHHTKSGVGAKLLKKSNFRGVYVTVQPKQSTGA